REGFLHQKLMEPRSYDYGRLRTWDDRLRMPQFRFSRKVAKIPGDKELADLNDDEKNEIALIDREEALAREAIITFVLGLVAEPIPMDFVYSPPKDRLDQIKGQHVLDKFNCAGCHRLHSGSYDFKTNPALIKDLEDRYKELTAPTNTTYVND